MSETRKDEGNAGLTHSGPCKACGQTIPAIPLAAETRVRMTLEAVPDARVIVVRRQDAEALLARVAPRTTTYPHDCGCETCPEHTESRATPPAAETGEPVARELAMLEDYIRSDVKTVGGRANALISVSNLRALLAAPAPREVSEDTARLDWLEANSSAYNSAIEMEHHAHLHGDINEPLRLRIDATRAALSAETGTP